MTDPRPSESLPERPPLPPLPAEPPAESREESAAAPAAHAAGQPADRDAAVPSSPAYGSPSSPPPNPYGQSSARHAPRPQVTAQEPRYDAPAQPAQFRQQPVQQQPVQQAPPQQSGFAPPSSPGFGPADGYSRPAYGQAAYGQAAYGQAPYGQPSPQPGYGQQGQTQTAPGQPAYGQPGPVAHAGYAQPYGMPAAPARPAARFATTGIVLGAIGVVGGIFFGWTILLSIAAIVLGFVARSREPHAAGIALAAIVTGFIGVILSAGWLVYSVVTWLALTAS